MFEPERLVPCAPRRIRTPGLDVRTVLLYPLSYRGMTTILFYQLGVGLTNVFWFAKVNRMNKTAFAAAALSLSLLTTQIVFAQDSTPGATVRMNRPLTTPRIEKRMDNLQTRMDGFRVKMASREAALKLKLDNFKDQKKAQIAQRVNTNLNQINANQTKQMQSYLDKMSALLDKLEARVNSGSPDIKDPVSAKAAIANSRAAIATASAAVSTQSLNDYTITVTTESRIKLDAMAQREKLFKDLKTVRALVIDAKQSVSNAIRVAKSLGKEATESGTQ